MEVQYAIFNMGPMEITIGFFLLIIPVYAFYKFGVYRTHYKINKEKEDALKVFCQACGAKNSRENQYCVKCGSKISPN
jgi:hypothetical protein